MYVDLGDEQGTYTVDWDRLRVWFPIEGKEGDTGRDFRAPDFLRSCARERSHQKMGDRMRGWMQRNGTTHIQAGIDGR